MNILEELITEVSQPWEDYQTYKYPLATTSFTVSKVSLSDHWLKPGHFKGVYRWNPEYLEKKLTSALRKHLGMPNIEAKVITDDMSIEEVQLNYSIRKDAEGAHDVLKKFFNESITFCHEALGSAFVSAYPEKVWINETLKTRIEWPEINLSYNGDLSRKVSLLGIDKLLDCQTILIFGAGQVESGGLGLLNIKSLKNLISLDSGFVKDQWLRIVKKHLNTKDLLGCQDDLLDAGLKQHAKL